MLQKPLQVVKEVLRYLGIFVFGIIFIYSCSNPNIQEQSVFDSQVSEAIKNEEVEIVPNTTTNYGTTKIKGVQQYSINEEELWRDFEQQTSANTDYFSDELKAMIVEGVYRAYPVQSFELKEIKENKYKSKVEKNIKYCLEIRHLGEAEFCVKEFAEFWRDEGACTLIREIGKSDIDVENVYLKCLSDVNTRKEEYRQFNEKGLIPILTLNCETDFNRAGCYLDLWEKSCYCDKSCKSEYLDVFGVIIPPMVGRFKQCKLKYFEIINNPQSTIENCKTITKEECNDGSRSDAYPVCYYYFVYATFDQDLCNYFEDSYQKEKCIINVNQKIEEFGTPNNYLNSNQYYPHTIC